MGDIESCILHCRARQEEGEEISDAAARVIAQLYHDGSELTLSFVSTGAIPEDSTALYRAFAQDYDRRPADERILFDMLGTYLLNRADRGPVEGWDRLWI